MERRLGKGLGVLLGAAPTVEARSSTVELPLDSLRANPFQPRKSFDQQSLDELADSIQSHGVLQPVVVRVVRDGYELIAGERRWRASQLAGRKTIAAVVLPQVADAQMLEIALIENVQRQDLNAIERARGYQQMMQSLGITQDDVAKKVGLKRSTVANHLRLLDLPVEIQEAVGHGLVSMGHARALLGLSDGSGALLIVERIVREDLSVRQVEKLVRDTTLKPARRAEPVKSIVPQPAWARELEERMRRNLGTKVSLQNGPGYRGQIVIEYFSRGDLERVCQVLAPREEIT